MLFFKISWLSSQYIFIYRALADCCQAEETDLGGLFFFLGGGEKWQKMEYCITHYTQKSTLLWTIYCTLYRYNLRYLANYLLLPRPVTLLFLITGSPFPIPLCMLLIDPIQLRACWMALPTPHPEYSRGTYLAIEFEKLVVDTSNIRCDEANKACNRLKSRFSQARPFDHSRYGVLSSFFLGKGGFFTLFIYYIAVLLPLIFIGHI